MIQEIQTIWPDKTLISLLALATGQNGLSSNLAVEDTLASDYKLQRGINIAKVVVIANSKYKHEGP